MVDTPTTWRVTPACATEEMIEAGVAELRSMPDLYLMTAWSIAERVINAALKASPSPPALPEPPATGGAEHD